MTTKRAAGNISYPASSAAVVFGGYLSAQTVFRLDRKSPAVRPFYVVIQIFHSLFFYYFSIIQPVNFLNH